jgi:hypothetical protein
VVRITRLKPDSDELESTASGVFLTARFRTTGRKTRHLAHGRIVPSSLPKTQPVGIGKPATDLVLVVPHIGAEITKLLLPIADYYRCSLVKCVIYTLLVC